MDCDHTIHRIIVTRRGFVNRKVPSRSVVEDSLLEFKTIRISIESLVVGERSVDEEDNFLTNFIIDGNTIDESFEFNDVSVVIASIHSQL